MLTGDFIKCCGFVTKLIYVINKNATELEDRLGYNRGRLDAGWMLLLLKEPVRPNEFELGGMSYFSGGRIGHPDLGDARPTVEDDYARTIGDPGRIKAQQAQEVFVTSGVNRIAKVIPIAGRDGRMSDADAFPVGHGIPQWRLTADKLFIVAAVLQRGARHLGGGADGPIPAMWIDPAWAKTL